MTTFQAIALTTGCWLILWALARVPGKLRQLRREWRAAGRLVRDASAADPPRPDGDANVPPHGPVTTIIQPCGCANQMARIRVDRCPDHARPARLRAVPSRDRKPGGPA